MRYDESPVYPPPPKSAPLVPPRKSLKSPVSYHRTTRPEPQTLLSPPQTSVNLLPRPPRRQTAKLLTYFPRTPLPVPVSFDHPNLNPHRTHTRTPGGSTSSTPSTLRPRVLTSGNPNGRDTDPDSHPWTALHHTCHSSGSLGGVVPTESLTTPIPWSAPNPLDLWTGPLLVIPPVIGNRVGPVSLIIGVSELYPGHPSFFSPPPRTTEYGH